MISNERATRAIIGWVEDASHAWLAVTLDTDHGCPEAGKFASSFSPYDVTGDNFAGIVYLEEDEDAPAFLKASGFDLGEVNFPVYQLPEDNTLRDLPRLEAYEVA